MKIIIFIFVVLSVQICECQPNVDRPNDELTVVDSEYEAIDDLKRNIGTFLDRVIKDIPDGIRKEILSCETPQEMRGLPIESQRWIQETVAQISDLNVAKAFEKLSGNLRDGGDRITGEDLGGIQKYAFWCKLHHKPIDLDDRVLYYIVYWREHAIPDVKYSPQGRGEIRWIWKLNVKERLNGVLHVGLDVKRRTFICWERNIGLYFPEGDTLERIYSEIVQVPDMAGSDVGRGRVNE